MKFGRQLSELVHPKFRNYCVAYNMLKGYIRDTETNTGKILQTIQDATSAAVPFLPQAQADQLPEVLFQNALNSELEKVNRFCLLEEDVLLNDMRAVIRDLRSVDRSSQEATEVLKRETERISDELVAFGSFISLNHTAFRKITKKESKIHKTSSASWFMANVARAAFMNVDFDRLMTHLSICFQLIINPDTDLLGVPSTPPQSLTKGARVLSAWVSQEELLTVKVALSKAMTLQFKTNTQGFSGTDLLDSILASRKTQTRVSHRVEAVYYDTPWMESFEKEILQKSEWFGFQSETVDNATCVTLPSGPVVAGISSRVWEKTWSSQGESVQSNNSKLKNQHVGEIRQLSRAGYIPLVDCTFNRWVFRSQDNIHGQIEVCVDENVTYVAHAKREDSLSDPGSKFPGNVLYVTVPEDSPKELPDWLIEIIRVPGITEIPNFSKRIQGLFMYADKFMGGQNVPRPPWAPQKPPASTKQTRARIPSIVSPLVQPLDEPRYRKPRDEEGITTTTDEVCRNITRMISFLLGDRTSLSDGVIVRDALVKIEPKSFFACERTLLDWTHTTVLVSGLASLQGGFFGIGVALIPIIILIWEARLHRVRNSTMKNKECTDYSDPIGPPLLLISLTVLFCQISSDAFVGLVR